MPTTASESNTFGVKPIPTDDAAADAYDIRGGAGEDADPEAGDKRPADDDYDEDTSNKKAKTDDDNAEPPAEDLEWNALTETVREKLRSMDPGGGTPNPRSRNLPNLSIPAGQRVTKAEREVNKQKPIKKPNSVVAVPCMKMTPPLPPRCEGDPNPTAEVPAFCQLVNFPTARYFGNCVMCDDAEFSIPKQNRGVCNNCDVAIWVLNPSGMQIKWCKGCKNFRKWIDFGVKVRQKMGSCLHTLK